MTEKVPTAFGNVTPAFVPDQWMAKLMDSWAEREERIARHYLILSGIDPDNRPTVMVEQRIPADVLAARAEFKARWDALIEEGLDAGHLTQAACYECGGELTVRTETTTWESRPNPDYDPDKPNPYAQALEGETVDIPKLVRDALKTPPFKPTIFGAGRHYPIQEENPDD